ncbi:PH domain-containing protein [Cellulomonas aerilata]|uniref:Membrane protein n=1 Tax=Cellulomonas aerilata TaxID=515326 RepID=A0A512DEL2_9CELL|nr:PH domain-containing protein [Cellulomonas aerilata]GEO34886.1 membrane protein [Cellulomonas aerilata]
MTAGPQDPAVARADDAVPHDAVRHDAVPHDAVPHDAVPHDAVRDPTVPDDAVPADAVPADATVVTGEAAAAPPGLVWNRMHPVTPAVKGWKVLVVLVFIAVQQAGDDLLRAREALAGRGWLVVLGVVVAGALLGFGYAALAWRMTRYAVDDDAVYLHSGVLFRQQRKARLDRLQAVDVVQPMLARLLGLAELKLEVAGGPGSAVSLAFLREEQSETLRAELLARAAGLQREEGRAAEPSPEQPVIEVPPGRLVAAMLRSGSMLAFLAGVVVVVVVVVVTREPGAVLFLAPAFLGIVGVLWTQFSRDFNFHAAISADGIRLRHGLLESRSQTVPPGRVQALRVSQGPLWRRRGWWRVDINVAGYGGAQDAAAENVLLPVGDRDAALTAVWLVLPDLGVADPRGVLTAAMEGTGTDGGFTTSARGARWLDPWAWRRTGYRVTDRALLLRTGRWVRRLVVVPHERTQSLGLEQGPLQRRLGLATFVVHTTPGPVSPRVSHLSGAVAGRLMDEQTTRARHARAGAGPELWLRPTTPTAASSSGATSLGGPGGPGGPGGSSGAAGSTTTDPGAAL